MEHALFDPQILTLVNESREFYSRRTPGHGPGTPGIELSTLAHGNQILRICL